MTARTEKKRAKRLRRMQELGLSVATPVLITSGPLPTSREVHSRANEKHERTARFAPPWLCNAPLRDRRRHRRAIRKRITMRYRYWRSVPPVLCERLELGGWLRACTFSTCTVR
jgi:hypothetical protein